MAELTEDEYAVLSSIVEANRQNRESSLGVCYFVTRAEHNAKAVDSLLAKKFIQVARGFMGDTRLAITKAGVRAMAEHAVHKQFAEFDRRWDYVQGADEPERMYWWACEELIGIVRDQARRIAELEAKS